MLSVLSSFNEAEAIKPRKRQVVDCVNPIATICGCFNEAEAIKPRKPR